MAGHADSVADQVDSVTARTEQVRPTPSNDATAQSRSPAAQSAAGFAYRLSMTTGPRRGSARPAKLRRQPVSTLPGSACCLTGMVERMRVIVVVPVMESTASSYPTALDNMTRLRRSG
jgi:hypothetical protein